MESLCVRVPKKSGEITRQELVGLGAIDKNLKIKHDGGDLLIPVLGNVEGFGELSKDYFEILQKEEPLAGIAGAYERLGDIAIIDQHESDAQGMADILIKSNKIRTVLQAESPIEGEYRTRQFSLMAGEKRTETLYRENGCRYLLDVAKVYFTPRLSTERMRIADQVKDGDTVVDMFAGVGPFSILIAKKYPSSQVIAIDKNPVAIKYLRENVRLNKVKNVEAREGDARGEVRGIMDADCIIMNLPHSSIEFLDTALGIIKKGGVIHLYAITHEDDLFEGTLEKIGNIAQQANFHVVALDRRIVRSYAPYQHNVCIDFKVM